MEHLSADSQLVFVKLEALPIIIIRRFINLSTRKRYPSGSKPVCVLLSSAKTARHQRPRGSTCALSYHRSKLISCVSGDVINSFCKTGENDQFRIFPTGEIRRRLGTQTLSKRSEPPLCSAGCSSHSVPPTASGFALRAELWLLNAVLWGIARSFNKTIPFGSFEGAAGHVGICFFVLTRADTSALLACRMWSSGMFGCRRATCGLEIRRGGRHTPV